METKISTVMKKKSLLQVKVENFVKLLLTAVSIALISCQASPPPIVEEIDKTFQPTIFGGTNVNLTASSLTFVVTGTCDPRSVSTEYSTNNGSTWTNIGPCANGTYSFSVNVFSTLTVKVRSKTSFYHTQASVAYITSTNTTTNVVLTFVTASRSDLANMSAPTLSFTMPAFMTGVRTNPPSDFNINLHPTGVVYAQ
ncbi:MAG: hypothetical protein ACK5WZ_11370 [Pseudobdellovibrionaceae bacterium]